MVMGSRMQHGSAQPTAAHALQGKRNARVVGCDEDNAQPAAAYALQRYEILLIDPWLTHDARSCFFLLYAAWVRSRAERPSVSYTKVVMEVAWTGHNLQCKKTN